MHIKTKLEDNKQDMKDTELQCSHLINAFLITFLHRLPVLYAQFLCTDNTSH